MLRDLVAVLIASLVQKSSIIESILDWAKFKADQQIKKTDGTKRTR